MAGCDAGCRGVTGIVAALVQRLRVITRYTRSAPVEAAIARADATGNAREQIGVDGVAVPWFCVTLNGERQHASLDARLGTH
jgi:hypothetical protein